VTLVVAALSPSPRSSPPWRRCPPRTLPVRCPFSHRNSDDPIKYPYPPGNQGAAHSHDFFGNTSTKFDSTYGTMTAALTTCEESHPEG
jgi:hypothetical protein